MKSCAGIKELLFCLYLDQSRMQNYKNATEKPCFINRVTRFGLDFRSVMAVNVIVRQNTHNKL